MSEFRVGDRIKVTVSPESLWDGVAVGSILTIVEDMGTAWISDYALEHSWQDHAHDLGYVFELVNYVAPTPVVGNPKYNREIKPGTFVDVYDVLYAFKVTDPCLQHLIKKALAAGQRGHKDARQDLVDIRDSAQRALDSHDLWETQE